MTQDTKPHAEGGSSILARYATGIDHVAIAVPDLETSIEFYSKVLGFELVERRRTEGTATAMVSAVMKAGPLTFVLIQGTSPQSQVSRFIEHYGPGVQHIAISVENIEEPKNQARALAVQHGRAKADQLASLAGMRITGVKSMSESDASSGPVPVAQPMAARSEAAAAPPVEPGTQEVRTQVTVTYIME